MQEGALILNIFDDGLAPISVSVYTRLNHFMECIHALQKNSLAPQSVLYIFSDAAKAGDEEQVRSVREFAEDINGFKEVRLFFRDDNSYKINMHDARTIPVADFGKVIRLEDDIIVATGFLTFMNQALSFFKEDKRVISIAGYTPPMKLPNGYKKDYFVLPRHVSWGCGLFQRTIDVLNAPLGDAERAQILHDALHNPQLKVAGSDLPQKARHMAARPYVTGDIMLTYHAVLTGALTIYPRKSLTRNIGHDGTGVHCGKSEKFEVPSLWDKTESFAFDTDLRLDKRILKAHRAFRKPIMQKSIRSRARALLIRAILSLSQSFAFRNASKVVVASTGRSGSTMLTNAVADAMVQTYCARLPLRVQKALRGRLVEFIARLDHLTLSTALVAKTHDLHKSEFLKGCKVLFVYGDPLESALSVAKQGKKKGSVWIDQHIYHLCGAGQSADIFQQDVLNFKAQILSWGHQANVLSVHYDDLWDRLDEISAFVGFPVTLPDRKERVEKSAPEDINIAMFTELSELAKELRNSNSGSANGLP